MAEEHLTPENVGRLAAAAGVGRVILTHFATPPGIETFDRAAMLAEIRKHYAGPVDFGEDLATYDLGIGKGDPR
jgi:ribonuclease BN (tRNA processing enzyme)